MPPGWPRKAFTSARHHGNIQGWLGQIYTPSRYEYRGKVVTSRFERDCLSEYAEVFRTVSVDAAYYDFPRAEYLQKLADAVPSDFRFGFKVTDAITVKRFSMSNHCSLGAVLNPRGVKGPAHDGKRTGRLSSKRNRCKCIPFVPNRLNGQPMETPKKRTKIPPND
jgi:hypothetical protein